MQVSAHMVQQWVCEWLLTSAVISAIECGWHRLPMGAQLDILQNLVANTRSLRSATVHTWIQAVPARPRTGWWWIAPSRYEDQRPSTDSVLWLTQAGPSWDGCAGRVSVALSTGHSLGLIARTSDLSAWTVVSWTPVALTGNGESGFDSGEGA